MRFVHHYDDVCPLIQSTARFAKLVDRRDEHLPHALPQQTLQFLPRRHTNHVRHVGGVERGCDLRVKVDAVYHDDNGGVTQLRV